MQMDRRANVDSKNRRLDVVGIRNPDKAVDERRRQMPQSIMYIMYCGGCRLRPINKRPMSDTAAWRGGRQTQAVLSVLGLWFRKVLERTPVGAAFLEKKWEGERHRKLRRTSKKNIKKKTLASLVKVSSIPFWTMASSCL